MRQVAKGHLAACHYSEAITSRIAEASAASVRPGTRGPPRARSTSRDPGRKMPGKSQYEGSERSRVGLHAACKLCASASAGAGFDSVAQSVGAAQRRRNMGRRCGDVV